MQVAQNNWYDCKITHLGYFFGHWTNVGALIKPYISCFGMCFSIFQIAKSDVDTIWSWLTLNGGHIKTKLDKTVTHLVTTLPSGVSIYFSVF